MNTAHGSRILKVDHAGEHGAVSIYTAQVLCARLTALDLVDELRRFKRHEERHRDLFRRELARRGVRRCRSYLLCGLGGWLLGAVTGLMGRGAIAATTVAIEKVVLRHLDQQLQQLRGRDEAAAAAVAAIVAEEREHHDLAALHARADRWWLKVLTPSVALATEAVIRTGMRL